MKALVGAFNQEKALVGAFSVIVRTTGWGTDGALHSTGTSVEQNMIFYIVAGPGHVTAQIIRLIFYT